MSKKRDKFTEAYYQYYSLVFSSVYAKVGNVDDAHDICQDVFIRFFEKIDDIQNFKKWLFGTLRNVVYEYYRKNTNKSIDIDDVFNDIGLTFINGMKESRIIINDALNYIDSTLNEKERTVFDLIAIFNYSYAETAKHMGLTKRKVEYAYKKIVGKILDYLNKKGIRDLEELL